MYDASMTLAVLTITMDKECTNHIDLSCQTQIFPMSVTNGLGKFSDVASRQWEIMDTRQRSFTKTFTSKCVKLASGMTRSYP